MTSVNGGAFQESTSTIDDLVQKVQALPDPAARTVALDLVQVVLHLHASALRRMLEIVAQPATLAALGQDELVSRVLVLHGLHPDGFEARLARALEKLQLHFDSRGARIEVLAAGPELLRVRFTGKRRGAEEAARRTIEDAIYEAVPEVGELIVESAGEEREAGFVPLASLLATQHA